MPDKKWILNLNNYRNTNFRVLNDCKVIYKALIQDLIGETYKFDMCELIFEYYHGNKRRVDKSNPCSILEKFACDALTDLGFWEDDDSNHIPVTRYEWCGIDKENPRCILTINEL